WSRGVGRLADPVVSQRSLANEPVRVIDLRHACSRLLLFPRAGRKPVGMMLLGKTLVCPADAGRIGRIVKTKDLVCIHEGEEIAPGRGRHARRTAEYVPVPSSDWVRNSSSKPAEADAQVTGLQ